MSMFPTVLHCEQILLCYWENWNKIIIISSIFHQMWIFLILIRKRVSFFFFPFEGERNSGWGVLSRHVVGSSYRLICLLPRDWHRNCCFLDQRGRLLFEFFPLFAYSFLRNFHTRHLLFVLHLPALTHPTNRDKNVCPSSACPPTPFSI